MKINRRMFLAGSASAAALAALAACSGSDSSSSATAVKLDGSDLNPQDRDALQDGGSLTIPIGQIIPNFNPLQMDGNLYDNATTLNLFISPANWVYAEDATFTARPEFCKEFTSEEKDGKTVVTLTLNPDARWNNGSPITWADYEATWKACNGEDEAFKAVVATTDGYNHIESVVQGVDEYQVVITFKAIFPDWGTVTGAALPASLCKDVDTFANGWKDGSVTDYAAGPFIVTSYDSTSGTIVLGRNASWWGEPAKLEKITLKVIDPSQLGTAFANKEIDIVTPVIDSSTYQQCGQRKDGEVRQSAGVSWRHFTMNGASGILADQKLRQALVKGMDRVTMTEADLQGLPVPASQLQLGNHLFMPQENGYKDNTGDFAFDAEKAKSELDKLGWKVPDNAQDGIREKDGTRLSIKYLRLPSLSTSATEGKILQANMKEIGVEIVMDDTNDNDFFPERIAKGNFEIVAFTWVGTPYPMANIGQIYGDGAVQNYGKISSDKITEYIEKVATEGDEDKRIKLANEADAEIWNLCGTIPIYVRADYTAVPASLANYGSFGLSTGRPEDIGYVAGSASATPTA